MSSSVTAAESKIAGPTLAQPPPAPPAFALAISSGRIGTTSPAGLPRGEKYKLNMMRGTGVFGKLGGGDSQREGLEALGRWFSRFAADP